HQRLEFVVHHANQGLAGGQRGDDLLADGLFLDLGDEVLHHRQRDVGFEQRHAHLAHGLLDVFFRQAGLAAQGLDDFGQALSQIVEHVRAGLGRVTWSKLRLRMRTILLHLVPASLYAAGGLLFWRTCIMGGAGRDQSRECMSTRERLLLLAAVLTHGAALHAAIFPGMDMRFGFGVALSLMVWLAVCFYWVETLYTRLEGLHGVIMSAGALASLFPLFFPGDHVLANAASPAFRVHFVIAMLAYSLFTLAALHA